MSDEFMLYDLHVEVIAGDKPFVCSHHQGQGFDVIGENLVFPQGGQFSLYALAALLPLLPVKQRPTADTDWMTTDTDIACPDPYCGARFRITRHKQRIFKHHECTKVPLQQQQGEKGEQ
mgnify:FL=1